MAVDGNGQQWARVGCVTTFGESFFRIELRAGRELSLVEFSLAKVERLARRCKQGGHLPSAEARRVSLSWSVSRVVCLAIICHCRRAMANNFPLI